MAILKPSSVDKLSDPYLSDFKLTSKLSSGFNSIKDERVTLKEVSYSKIGFFKKIIFKEIGFEGEIIVFSALEALSKYFAITIRLLIIDI